MSFLTIGVSISFLFSNTNSLTSESCNPFTDNYCFVQEEVDEDAIIASSSSSEDPDYLLDIYNHSFYFNYQLPRNFKYNELSLRQNVQVGDLVYERNQIGGIGHIGIVESVSTPSVYGSFIRTIEAVSGKVQYCFVDDNRFVEKNMMILRPVNLSNYVDDALYFARQQIGKPYYFDLTNARTSINNPTWYCSELVYASYLYAGLDLSFGSSFQPNHCILPNDIYSSYNTIETWMTPKFLTYYITNKEVFDWKVRIYNLNPFDLDYVYFNNKMVFSSSANHWTNLNEIDDISLSEYGEIGYYQEVTISENLACTHITGSFVYGNIRIITAANNIQSNSTPTMWFNYEWENTL